MRGLRYGSMRSGRTTGREGTGGNRAQAPHRRCRRRAARRRQRLHPARERGPLRGGSGHRGRAVLVHADLRDRARRSSDCRTLSAQLDVAVFWANTHHTASRATADGATSSAVRHRRRRAVPLPRRTHDVRPEPARHPPLRRHHADRAGRGHRVQRDVGEPRPRASPAPTTCGRSRQTAPGGSGCGSCGRSRTSRTSSPPRTPCLAASGAVYDVTAGCYTATHPNPLNILVSNDDGYANLGIDHAVEALRTLPNVELTVSAPATNQSGTGGQDVARPAHRDRRHDAVGLPGEGGPGLPGRRGPLRPPVPAT